MFVFTLGISRVCVYFKDISCLCCLLKGYLVFVFTLGISSVFVYLRDI